ncbi:GNAT family N-acetyltransferase [Methanosarcina sp. UBA5]|uniref:GNAT family N-acetyltransferase n=1 Tax=Methanosarcina sp. UBA5 TaxID=1915593 RepID=UPI0025F029E2|nr:GNAT family N-acetyltransferase [Methanosarcina sp. UBA5]
MRCEGKKSGHTLSLPTEKIDFTEGFLGSMGGDDHVLVSELEGKVVGMVELHFLKSARQKHSAFLGIMVRTEYQGQGIGKNLMKKTF